MIAHPVLLVVVFVAGCYAGRAWSRAVAGLDAALTWDRHCDAALAVADPARAET